MENPIKMDDLGVPLFLETPILIIMNLIISISQALNAWSVYLHLGHFLEGFIYVSCR